MIRCRVRVLFVVSSVLVVSGCFAHGFDRGAMFSRLQLDQTPETDEEIVKVQALQPQLPFPCRVAIYLPPRVNGRWSAHEKEIIDSWTAPLKNEGIVSDMFVMSDMITTGSKDGPNLKDLRIAAARHGANALLIIQGDYDVDSYQNPAAVFNLTIIGGYIIPASHRDALFVLQGVLVDVGNGFLYASVEAEGEAHTIRPTFLAEDKPAVEKARCQALEHFGPELLKRMRNVYATCNRSPVVPVSAITK